MKKLLSLLVKAAFCVLALVIGIHVANTVVDMADPWKDKAPEKLTDVGSPYKFYYDRLDDIEKHTYNEILSSVYDMPEKVRIPDVDGEQLDRVFTALLADNPDLFFVARRCTLTAKGLLNFCAVDYYIDKETYAQQKKKLDEVCAEVLSSLSDPEDEFRTELEIHDYIVEKCKYRLEKDEFVYSSSYGALVNGEAACEGYSKAAKLLFDMAGIESAVVSGISSNNEESEGPHMWNAVKINGDFYHLDCTWDDPLSKSGESVLVYEFFNLDDETISETHRDFSIDFECDSTAENYYIKMGTFFESYDRSCEKKLSSIIADEIEKGGDVIQLYFGNKKAYKKAVFELVDSGRLYNVLKSAKEKTDVEFSTDSIYYYSDSGQRLLTLVIEN